MSGRAPRPDRTFRHRALPQGNHPAAPGPGGITRRYGRYGISEAAFRERLARVPTPAAILVTSLMTYWYPGVAAAIRLARERFPDVPVILGGIYATLCPEHAQEHSGADRVVAGPGEAAIGPLLEEITGFSPPGPICSRPGRLGLPALSGPGPPGPSRLISPSSPPGAAPWIVTTAPPGSSSRFTGGATPWPRRPSWFTGRTESGLADAAFYDDALLLGASDHLLVILAELARRGRTFRFHTPNGLHARLITREVAGWLKRANFATLRLGVETTALGAARLDAKLQAGELEAALAHLQEAGFAPEAIGVYLLIGLPDQAEAEVAASILRVKELGATPVLAHTPPSPAPPCGPGP